MRKKRDRESLDLRQLEKPDGQLRFSGNAIIHAASIILKEMGYANASKVVKKILDDPTIGDSIMDFLDNPPPPPVKKLSTLGALGFMIHHDQSKVDMKAVKGISKTCNADFMPNYDYIRMEKQFCRPPKPLMTITETQAFVDLKDLVVHTIDRILEIPRVRQKFLALKETETEVRANFSGKFGNDT